MPSGSHSSSGHGAGSSGGGHSSGGWSSSGGSSGSNRPRSPMVVVVGGRRYTYSTGAQSGISILFFVALFAFLLLAAFIPTASSATKEIEKIKVDQAYYLDMIAHAEANNLIVDGKVSGKFYDTDAGKWYLTYKFKIGDTGNAWLDGYTFSLYTTEEVAAFSVGDTIKLAVDELPTTSTTDSIPLDYKDMPIERDGTYLSAVNNKRIGTIGQVVVSFVGVGCSVAAIWIMTGKKKLAEQKSANENKQTPPPKPEKPNARYCSYCGSELEKDQKHCPNCGAKQ